MFMTSVRDVGRNSDCNGDTVNVGGEQRYMRGLIEASVDGIVGGDQIADHLDVAGIVYDDMPQELQRDGYAVQPRQGDQWIYPVGRYNRAIGGEPLGDITHHVPSNFRQLPIGDTEGRAAGKAEFEQRVVDLMEESGADILVSDHLIMRIENLIRQRAHGLLGRVLNIHPAMTHEDHPHQLRGLTPTQDAIDRAAGRNGVVHNRTGATFHFVAPEIDAGPVICDDEPTPVRATDEPMELRHRNYGMAKIPVFMEGMRHYHQTMFHRVLGNPQFVTHPQYEQLDRAATA
jgi:hypothetical protein